jgi:hypothetical protein
VTTNQNEELETNLVNSFDSFLSVPSFRNLMKLFLSGVTYREANEASSNQD